MAMTSPFGGAKPRPKPAISRPSVAASSEARYLAQTKGCRYGVTTTLNPMRMRDVALIMAMLLADEGRDSPVWWPLLGIREDWDVRNLH
jgi:hypothetical protein